MLTLKRILVALIVAVTGTVAAPAAPANAGQVVRVCIQTGTFGGIPLIQCFLVEFPDLGPKPPWPPTCLSCPIAFDIREWLDPAIREQVYEGIGNGMAYLGMVEMTKDEYERKKLRELATKEFLGAAALLDGKELRLNNVGWADLKKPAFLPDTTGNTTLKDAGSNLVRGIGLMQKALGDPDPEPSIQAGLSAFGTAYQNIDALWGN